jgi:hypothetical protein
MGEINARIGVYTHRSGMRSPYPHALVSAHRTRGQKKSPRPCDLGLNPPKEEGGGDNLGKTNGKKLKQQANKNAIQPFLSAGNASCYCGANPYS